MIDDYLPWILLTLSFIVAIYYNRFINSKTSSEVQKVIEAEGGSLIKAEHTHNYLHKSFVQVEYVDEYGNRKGEMWVSYFGQTPVRQK